MRDDLAWGMIWHGTPAVRPLPEMLAFFFAFLKDLALEFAFSHFSGICTKNRIFRQLSQLPILFYVDPHALAGIVICRSTRLQ